MKKILLAISLVVALAGLALGQNAETRANANSDSSIRKEGRQLNLQSGTQLAAQLENSLDARRAKPGDRVVLKTIQAVKQDGKVIVPKGARLIGHVTEVQQQTKSNAESRISVVFDRLRTGSIETPITANVLSITQGRAQASNSDRFESDTMGRSSSSSRTTSSGSGGGLLGGVVNTTTSTVGSVAGSTTSAVGSTVGATTDTAGSATANLSGTLEGLQITQSSNASAEGGLTLSLTGRNLRLESGTTFNLSVRSSTSAGTP